MSLVQRFDFYSKTSVQKTDSGFLRVPIRATRTGVLKYVMPDGTIRRELRPPEEVFKNDSMKTLSGIPITYLHPNELVGLKNAKKLSIGLTGDVPEKAEGKFLDIMGTITDESVVGLIEKKIDNGEDQEVSCGYVCRIDEAPGTFEGESYDVIQRDIKYNHVALVPKGRCGENVKLRLDDNQAVLYNENVTVTKTENFKMKKIKFDGQEIEVSEEAAKVIEQGQAKTQAELDAEKAKVVSSEAKVAEVTKAKDEIEAKKDAAETEVKTLKEKIEKTAKMDHNEIDKLVAERSAIVDVATKVIKDFKKDGKDNLSIKKEVIKAVSPELKLDEKSEDYINARFDAIAEKSDDAANQVAEALKAKAKEEGKKDGMDDKKVDARQKMIEETKKAWENPTK